MRDTGRGRQGANAEVPPTAADRTQAFAAEPLLEPVHLPLFANVMAEDVRAGKVDRAVLEMGHEEIKERLARGEEWEQRGTRPGTGMMLNQWARDYCSSHFSSTCESHPKHIGIFCAGAGWFTQSILCALASLHC